MVEYGKEQVRDVLGLVYGDAATKIDTLIDNESGGYQVTYTLREVDRVDSFTGRKMALDLDRWGLGTMTTSEEDASGHFAGGDGRLLVVPGYRVLRSGSLLVAKLTSSEGLGTLSSVEGFKMLAPVLPGRELEIETFDMQKGADSSSARVQWGVNGQVVATADKITIKKRGETGNLLTPPTTPIEFVAQALVFAGLVVKAENQRGKYLPLLTGVESYDVPGSFKIGDTLTANVQVTDEGRLSRIDAEVLVDQRLVAVVRGLGGLLTARRAVSAILSNAP